MCAFNASFRDIANAFATALIEGRFEAAYALLDFNARETWSVSALQRRYSEMVGYFEMPPHHIEVVETMTEWPDQQPEDIGWAYVAIASDRESEAVIVIVCIENGRGLIRQVEWGRP